MNSFIINDLRRLLDEPSQPGRDRIFTGRIRVLKEQRGQSLDLMTVSAGVWPPKASGWGQIT
jgi:hypothetical protein